ncbi:hypothetical protein GCM10025760_24260 [Microbacterium yannicii]|uniref:CAAX prenyl protease 2/Lysostaphin resistance protein A-like domain-containing protein n=1 Tax=Microbacterium yannicii TaxID=671622 RepID=A0ABP9MBA4_9MICO|nr:CPBP family intramembrane metalloprotease [Microbacterium yannicii]
MPDKPSDASSGGAPPVFEPVDVWAIEAPNAMAQADFEAAADAQRGQDAAGSLEPSAEEKRRGRSRSRAPRTDWRLGGRTVLRWREGLLAVALISLGLGVVAATVVSQFWLSPWAAASATILIGIGMLVPVVWAFSRSRPVGLLRFRAIDLLYGLVLGALLRTTQGWLQGMGGSPAPLPSFSRVDGAISVTTVLGDILAPVLVAPLLEELFFRGVVLVALYTVLRRPFGKVAAGVGAVAGSAALFVVAHAMLGSTSVDGIVVLTLLASVCGLLVILTGRIWGAVLTHAVFNATFVVLALAGTFWN